MKPHSALSTQPRRRRLDFELLEDRALPSTYSYLVIAQSESSLPADFSERIQAAGGEVRYTIPQIGVALVDSDERGFDDRAEHVPGIRSVVFAGVARPEVVGDPQITPPQPPLGPNVPVTPDEFSSLQWGLDAIDAPGAWAQGVSGDGVRVAILDSGFMNNHPDLHFNPVLSKSMVVGEPEENWAAADPLQVVVHGTMVAGVVGALDNGEGTVGVAPRADLVAVRVFPESITSTVDVVDAMRGIVYATDIDSDVINMSFLFIYNKSGWTYDPENTPNDPSDDVVETPQDSANIVRAFQRATDYAHDNGVVVVACAGNESTNHDAPDGDRLYFPQNLPHVITVSATGPLGIANDPNTDLDVPAYYTDYGQSYIDFAAPGGNIDFDLLESGELKTEFGITGPAFLWDGVFTTGTDPSPEEFPDVHINPGWGTSFASPHVAAVAALVIEAFGGQADPDEVFSILKRSADDLGKPGNDKFYGHGRVNAAAAVARALKDCGDGAGGARASVPPPRRSVAPPASPGDRFAGGGSVHWAFLPASNNAVGWGHPDLSDEPPRDVSPRRAYLALPGSNTGLISRVGLFAAPAITPAGELFGGQGIDWFRSNESLDRLDIAPVEVKY